MATTNRIEIRGVIVPSDYDDTFFEDYIAKGIITPESTFRRALSEADPNEPLEVYVNTPGGSVFAGNEMINAVREWKVANSQPVTVIIGAMAASMGAAFTISAPDTVKVHSNAKIMFHGAWGLAIGGSEVMSDVSELLAKINADIKTTLLSRYDLAPETVEEWFAEGREGWLSASEMVEVGIAQEIIGEAAEPVRFAPDDLTNMGEHGLKLAALFDAAGLEQDEPEHVVEVAKAEEVKDEPKANTDEGVIDDEPKPAPAIVAEDEPKPAPSSDDDLAPVVAEAPDPSDAIRDAVRGEVMLDVMEDIEALNGKIAKRDALIASLQSERDSTRAENDKLTTNIGNLEKRLKTLLTGSLTYSPVAETKEEKDVAKAIEPKRDDPKPQKPATNHSRAHRG